MMVLLNGPPLSNFVDRGLGEWEWLGPGSTKCFFFLTFEGGRGTWVYSSFFSEDGHEFYLFSFVSFLLFFLLLKRKGDVGFLFLFLNS